MPDIISQRKRLPLLQQQRHAKLLRSFPSRSTEGTTCWVISDNYPAEFVVEGKECRSYTVSLSKLCRSQIDGAVKQSRASRRMLEQTESES